MRTLLSLATVLALTACLAGEAATPRIGVSKPPRGLRVGQEWHAQVSVRGARPARFVVSSGRRVARFPLTKSRKPLPRARPVPGCRALALRRPRRPARPVRGQRARAPGGPRPPAAARDRRGERRQAPRCRLPGECRLPPGPVDRRGIDCRPRPRPARHSPGRRRDAAGLLGARTCSSWIRRPGRPA